jgi:ankyrin repeat protein
MTISINKTNFNNNNTQPINQKCEKSENLSYNPRRNKTLAESIFLQFHKITEIPPSYQKRLTNKAIVKAGVSNTKLLPAGRIPGRKTMLPADENSELWFKFRSGETNRLRPIQKELNNKLHNEAKKEQTSLTEVIKLLKQGAHAEHSIWYKGKSIPLSEYTLLKGDYELTRLLIANSKKQRLLPSLIESIPPSFKTEKKHQVKRDKILKTIKKLCKGMDLDILLHSKFATLVNFNWKYLSILQISMLKSPDECNKLFPFLLNEVLERGSPKHLAILCEQAFDLNKHVPLSTIREILAKIPKSENCVLIPKTNESSQSSSSQHFLTTEKLCDLASSPGKLKELYHYFKKGISKEILNNPNSKKMTPLGCAIEANNFDAVYYLCKAGADINKPSMAIKRGLYMGRRHAIQYEMTLPIIQAMPGDLWYYTKHSDSYDPVGNWKIALLLASRGAEITPRIAHHVYMKEDVADLIEFGATPTGDMLDLVEYSKTKEPTTAWLGKLISDYKKSNSFNKNELQKFLNKNLFRAIKGDPQDGELLLASFYLEQGADINAVDKNGNSPIMLAIIYGQVRNAKYLVKQKANLDLRNNNGDTALALAIQERDRSSVSVLLKKNPKLLLTDEWAQRALYVGLIDDNKHFSSYEVARKFVQYGYSLSKEKLIKLQKEHPNSKSISKALRLLVKD